MIRPLLGQETNADGLHCCTYFSLEFRRTLQTGATSAAVNRTLDTWRIAFKPAINTSTALESVLPRKKRRQEQKWEEY